MGMKTFYKLFIFSLKKPPSQEMRKTRKTSDCVAVRQKNGKKEVNERKNNGINGGKIFIFHSFIQQFIQSERSFSCV